MAALGLFKSMGSIAAAMLYVTSIHAPTPSHHLHATHHLVFIVMALLTWACSMISSSCLEPSLPPNLCHDGLHHDMRPYTSPQG